MAIDAAKLASLMKAKKLSMKKVEKTIKPTDGANRFVILPGWRKGEEHIWFHDYGQHFIKDAAGVIQAVYLCTDKTHGTSCPVCTAIGAGIRGAEDDDTIKSLKEANATQAYLLNVLALDTAEATTPQILQLGRTAYSALVDLMDDWGAGIFDDAEPMIVVINRSGKGLLTKYTVQISPKKSAMPKGVMDKLNNLDEYVAQESEEGSRKAIGAVYNVSGLIAPPSGADRPRLASAKKVEEADELDGLEDAPAKPVKAAPAKAAKAVKPAVEDDFDLDADLEAMLGEAE
jgi:hypothetical protein